MVGALLAADEAAARLIGVSEHCDHPAPLVAGCRVVTRAAVDLRGMDGEQVEAALRAARRDPDPNPYPYPNPNPNPNPNP